MLQTERKTETNVTDALARHAPHLQKLVDDIARAAIGDNVIDPFALDDARRDVIISLIELLWRCELDATDLADAPPLCYHQLRLTTFAHGITCQKNRLW